jgi:site-specific recombinase XerD
MTNRGRHQTLTKQTQNYYLIVLRSFLKYLVKRGIRTLPPDRIELAKVPERSLDLVSSDELARLLDAPQGSELKSLRDKAILELFFSTGLRVSELCSLSRYIDLSRDEFTVRGKGEKVRLVFLSDRAKEAVRSYLGQTSTKPCSSSSVGRCPRKRMMIFGSRRARSSASSSTMPPRPE